MCPLNLRAPGRRGSERGVIAAEIKLSCWLELALTCCSTCWRCTSICSISSNWVWRKACGEGAGRVPRAGAALGKGCPNSLFVLFVCCKIASLLYPTKVASIPTAHPALDALVPSPFWAITSFASPFCPLRLAHVDIAFTMFQDSRQRGWYKPPCPMVRQALGAARWTTSPSAGPPLAEEDSPELVADAVKRSFDR